MDYFKLLMIFLCIGATLGYLFLGLIIYILGKDMIQREKAKKEEKNATNNNN